MLPQRLLLYGGWWKDDVAQVGWTAAYSVTGYKGSRRDCCRGWLAEDDTRHGWRDWCAECQCQVGPHGIKTEGWITCGYSSDMSHPHNNHTNRIGV